MLDLNSKEISFGSRGTRRLTNNFANMPPMKYKDTTLLPKLDLYADRVFLYEGVDGLQAVVKLKTATDDALFKLVEGIDCNVVGLRPVGEYIVMNKMEGDLRDLARRMRAAGATEDRIITMAMGATLAVAETYACLMRYGLYYMDGKTDNSLFNLSPSGVVFQVGDLDSLHQLGDPGYVRTFVDPTVLDNYKKDYPRPALKTELAGKTYVAYQAWLVLFDFLSAAGIRNWYIPRAREVERISGTIATWRKNVTSYLNKMKTARRRNSKLDAAIKLLQPRMKEILGVTLDLIENTAP